MIPYFDYLEAKKRLANAKETIDLMGGESECPDMLLGQRDYLELEVEYFCERNGKYNLGLLIGGIISVIIVVLYHYGVLNV
jgi:hypothetical protein